MVSVSAVPTSNVPAILPAVVRVMAALNGAAVSMVTLSASLAGLRLPAVST